MVILKLKQMNVYQNANILINLEENDFLLKVDEIYNKIDK